MEGNVTVDQALSRAKWLIKRPMFFILLSAIFIKFFYFETIYSESVDVFLTIFIGLAFCWLYWSLTIPIWKIWAYTNVRNVHELKMKAIKNGFLFNDGNFFEKTEIKSYLQKEELKMLQKKFLVEDVYRDDITVARETKVYYSLLKLSIWFITMNFFIVGGIYLYITKLKSFPILFLIFLFVFFMFMCLKNLFNRNPQIIINDLGIQLKDDKIIEWKDIKSEIVYGKLTGKLNYNKYLSFNGIDILINDYDISMKELENLLQVYRTRYKKNNPN